MLSGCFARAGKKILCSLEDNSTRSLYVCANADRTVINPAGGIRFAGLRSQYFYIANMMRKLGIRADMLKSAIAKRRQRCSRTLLRAKPRRPITSGRSRKWKMYITRISRKVKWRRPTPVRPSRKDRFTEETREMRLVDGYAFDDQVDDVLTEMVGRKVRFQKYEEDTLAPDTFGPRGKVGLLLVDEDMVDGRSQTIPILGTKLLDLTRSQIPSNGSAKIRS